jgi:hypothetical protein
MNHSQNQLINEDINIENNKSEQIDFKKVLNYSSHQLQILTRKIVDLDSDEDDFFHPSYRKFLNFSSDRVIGSGSFGVVFQAILKDTNEVVAIKKVLQDRKFKVIVFIVYIFFEESRVTGNEDY